VESRRARYLLLRVAMRRGLRVGGRKRVTRMMRVLLEMLALHRTHMMMLPGRRHVHTLKVVRLGERPVQVLQGKQAWMRNMMRVRCLGDLRWMVVGMQGRLEREVCAAWCEVLRRMARMMRWGALRRRRQRGEGVFVQVRLARLQWVAGC
jgi:hypothetical protein